jgi:hypothetical protein
LQRYLLLVAESPRGHRLERQFLIRSKGGKFQPAPSGAGFILRG